MPVRSFRTFTVWNRCLRKEHTRNSRLCNGLAAPAHSPQKGVIDASRALPFQAEHVNNFIMTRTILAALAVSMASTVLMGQTVKTPSDATQDPQMAAVLQRLDKQSQQIEALAREVSRLSNAIENRSDLGGSHPGGKTASETPKATPVSAPTASPSPSVELPPGAVLHVVAKGENLTKIAAKYGASVEEILQINKIQDDRKLQIGQNLIIPKKGDASPTASPSAAATVTPTP